MAPSRGATNVAKSSPSSKSGTGSDESLVDSHSQSALTSARRNFRYLLDPNDGTARPASLRTRAALRTLHQFTVFVLWRVVRYAKYVAVASLVATCAATAFGGLVSGVGWVVAPTGIASTIFAYSVWGIGKWGARRLSRRWQHQYRKSAGYNDRDAEMERRRTAQMRGMVGSEALPW